MQVATDVPYIMASMGLRRLSTQSALDRMSLINQVPSGLTARRMAAIASAGRGMSWMQSSVTTRS